MFEQLIASKRKVSIYMVNETFCVTGVISDYYEKFGVIRVIEQDLILPVDMISRIILLEENKLHLNYNILITPTDFNSAVKRRCLVEVWHSDHPIYEGCIQKHTDAAVIVDGLHFMKGRCEFRIVRE